MTYSEAETGTTAIAECCSIAHDTYTSGPGFFR
jgi:hypothetical protein